MNWTGFRIWILAVLLNGLFLGVWAAFDESPMLFLPATFGIALIGIFITAPLLVIVMLLVDLAGKLPYAVGARIFWLFIMLALVGASYLFLLTLVIGRDFWKSENDLMSGLMLSMLLAIGLAVFSERKSLKRRYEKIEEKQEAVSLG